MMAELLNSSKKKQQPANRERKHWDIILVSGNEHFSYPTGFYLLT